MDVEIREMSVPDAYSFKPVQHEDDRGVFLEWYRFEGLSELLGRPFELRQANLSVSRRGVVRGIHYADVPPGQAKYVTVAAGAVLDFAVDLRVGSPTFGGWDSEVLDDVNRRAVYLGEGLGHAFVALSETAVVAYLASQVYAPARERSVSPFDSDIDLAFPAGLKLILSPSDAMAPSLAELRDDGRLPAWQAPVRHDERRD